MYCSESTRREPRKWGLFPQTSPWLWSTSRCLISNCWPTTRQYAILLSSRHCQNEGTSPRLPSWLWPQAEGSITVPAPNKNVCPSGMDPCLSLYHCELWYGLPWFHVTACQDCLRALTCCCAWSWWWRQYLGHYTKSHLSLRAAGACTVLEEGV